MVRGAGHLALERQAQVKRARSSRCPGRLYGGRGPVAARRVGLSLGSRQVHKLGSRGRGVSEWWRTEALEERRAG
jgi:hypothetical protein